MSLLSMIRGNGPSGFGYGSTAEQVTAGIDLSGKTVLVTGCNSGLGEETLRVLAKRGAHVIGAARNPQKAADALERQRADGTPVACELSEPSSVEKCVEEVKALGRPIDVIVCNAGIMALPTLETKHGIELQFLTNHIGHFILVTGLLDRVPEGGRIVVLSSSAHHGAYEEGIQFDNLDGKKGYKPWSAYGQSKLANLLFARELARRVTDRAISAAHPGVIKTNLGRHMNPFMRGGLAAFGPLALKSIPEGAATQCYLAAHPDGARARGEYYADCNLAKTSKHGRDDALATRLYEETEAIVERL